MPRPQVFLLEPGENPLDMPEIYERQKRQRRPLIIGLLALGIMSGIFYFILGRGHAPDAGTAQAAMLVGDLPTSMATVSIITGVTATGIVSPTLTATPEMLPTWTPSPTPKQRTATPVVIEKIIEVPVQVPVQIIVTQEVIRTQLIPVVVTATPIVEAPTLSPTPTETELPTATATQTQGSLDSSITPWVYTPLLANLVTFAPADAIANALIMPTPAPFAYPPPELP